MKKHQETKKKKWSYAAILLGAICFAGNLSLAYANTSGVQLQIQEQVVSLNQGSAEQLQQIKGIGPKLAQRIIDYRDENGLFETKEDLMNVKGIGELKFNKIKDSIQI